MKNQEKKLAKPKQMTTFLKLWLAPVLFMVGLSIIHLCFQNSDFLKKQLAITPTISTLEQSIFYLCIFLGVYWLAVRVIDKAFVLVRDTSSFDEHSLIKIVLPLFVVVLKILAFLILFNVLVQYINISAAMSFILTKLTSILIIVGISWILFKVVDVVEQLLVHRYLPKKSGTLAARKIYTQTLIIKRIVYSLIVILSLGAILMLFDNVRALGASVLTTAGVVGLVFTFAAQKSLTSILAGLEIAFTQPIKIGDTVVINNEFGTIEEINFRSVVVKLWDWRRLVVPTNYFLENVFQNWSRDKNNNLIGTVFLYVDFTLPVIQLREELNSILSKSPLWDGKVGNITVSDLQAQVMQLRVLASAKNADDVSALRNEVREKLIHYIVTHHPASLPKSRSISEKLPDLMVKPL
ncbi:mechanosensitive ion channel family protein [Legionella sp. km772]|uniref:mechanosensitive ion channel family protein n=1 Tax=Legionella sp. km772 TaxID=2498111 RepID=UPI000F8F0F5C|nr:mechanosensitive ion channel domain-containing protein [Legionella sp. km772]RUR07732.1 mechanosensitive ion channel [Legionella sp. km772]